MPNNLWNKQTFFTLAGILALFAGLVAFFYLEGLAGRPIYLYAIIIVAIIIAAVVAVYLYLLAKGKIQQTGPDYRTLFYLGLVFFIFGSASNPSFYVIGLVFVIVGLVNKKKWKPEPKWSEMSAAQKNFKIAAIAILFFLLIGGFIMWYLSGQNKDKNPDELYTGQVTSFAECVAAGNPVMESYPRQCRHGGQTFTESLTPDSQVPFRNGKYLGYIHALNTAELSLAFDDAVWLTGKAGQDAAIEAGHCTEATRSECLPNDYFIKNANIADETLLFDQNALLFMQTWKMEETGEVTTREIGLNDFAGLINDQALHWSTLPYNITIQNGKVTRIEEVYIP